MKKKISGVLLLLVGLGAVGLCMMMRSQFDELVKDPMSAPGKYPLVEMVMPKFAPSGRPDPQRVAQAGLIRIHSTGVAGLVLGVVGAFLLVRGNKDNE